MQTQNNEQREAPRPSMERVPRVAARLGISVSQVYREIKAGRLGPLVKIGERASALPSVAVDAFIQAKIDAVTKKGGAQC